jgi:hypothetical protein
MAVVRASFKPEFLNRLDDTVMFHPLTVQDLSKIVAIQVDDLAVRLRDKRLNLEVTTAAREWLTLKGFDPVYGARPLRRLIQTAIGDQLAKAILIGDIRVGDNVSVDVDPDPFNDGLLVEGSRKWTAVRLDQEARDRLSGMSERVSQLTALIGQRDDIAAAEREALEGRVESLRASIDALRAEIGPPDASAPVAPTTEGPADNELRESLERTIESLAALSGQLADLETEAGQDRSRAMSTEETNRQSVRRLNHMIEELDRRLARLSRQVPVRTRRMLGSRTPRIR